MATVHARCLGPHRPPVRNRHLRRPRAPLEGPARRTGHRAPGGGARAAASSPSRPRSCASAAQGTVDRRTLHATVTARPDADRARGRLRPLPQPVTGVTSGTIDITMPLADPKAAVAEARLDTLELATAGITARSTRAGGGQPAQPDPRVHDRPGRGQRRHRLRVRPHRARRERADRRAPRLRRRPGQDAPSRPASP